MNRRTLLACAWLLAAGAARAEMDPAELANAVADRYGVPDMHDIGALKFTFHVRRGTAAVERSWVWDRQQRRVFVSTIENGRAFDHSYTPGRLDAGNPDDAKADRWFVNDSFWLLFPLHLATDPGLALSIEEGAALPIPPGRADRLTVAYPDSGGYTPGDAYDVYVDHDGTILQWVYRKSGGAPTLATTWEEHARVGPIVVSLLHRSADGGLEIRFTGVAARLSGREKDDWTRPRPL